MGVGRDGGPRLAAHAGRACVTNLLTRHPAVSGRDRIARPRLERSRCAGIGASHRHQECRIPVPRKDLAKGDSSRRCWGAPASLGAANAHRLIKRAPRCFAASHPAVAGGGADRRTGIFASFGLAAEYQQLEAHILAGARTRAAPDEIEICRSGARLQRGPRCRPRKVGAMLAFLAGYITATSI